MPLSLAIVIGLTITPVADKSIGSRSSSLNICRGIKLGCHRRQEARFGHVIIRERVADGAVVADAELFTYTGSNITVFLVKNVRLHRGRHMVGSFDIVNAAQGAEEIVFAFHFKDNEDNSNILSWKVKQVYYLWQERTSAR